MSKTNPVDPNVPAGSEDPKLGDNRIRELAAAVAELLNIDHYMGTDGGAGTGYNEDAAGQHEAITLRVQGSTPAAVANAIMVFCKDVSAKGEFHLRDEDGNILQLSTGGNFNAALLNGLTIATLTLTSPVLNTSVSGDAVLDEDNMASNSNTKISTQQAIKAYVDTQVAGNAMSPASYVGGQSVTYSNGLIFKQGQVAVAGSSDAQITFDTPFPNDMQRGLATMASDDNGAVRAHTPTAPSMKVHNYAPGSASINWFAWGY